MIINRELRLERATEADALFLFDLKNEEGARLSALATKGHITWTEHVAWLHKTLVDANVNLYTIRDADNKLIGSWRYDFHPEHVECALVLIPEVRGRRIGSTVVNFCFDYIQSRTGKKIIGHIAEGNVPPMRYHIKAGFQLESYDRVRKCYTWTRDMAAFHSRQRSQLLPISAESYGVQDADGNSSEHQSDAAI